MFTGTYTASVTPFTKDGKVDEPRLRQLVEQQIAAGIDGLVPCGTTGESPDTRPRGTQPRHRTGGEVRGEAVQVIAGTGSNSTAEAVFMTQYAKKVGADASLQVAPYYNKPTQAGLYAHFRAIAEQADIPIILYNIPGRCGVDIANDTIARLRPICRSTSSG